MSKLQWKTFKGPTFNVEFTYWHIVLLVFEQEDVVAAQHWSVLDSLCKQQITWISVHCCSLCGPRGSRHCVVYCAMVAKFYWKLKLESVPSIDLVVSGKQILCTCYLWCIALFSRWHQSYAPLRVLPLTRLSLEINLAIKLTKLWRGDMRRRGCYNLVKWCHRPRMICSVFCMAICADTRLCWTRPTWGRDGQLEVSTCASFQAEFSFWCILCPNVLKIITVIFEIFSKSACPIWGKWSLSFISSFYYAVLCLVVYKNPSRDGRWSVQVYALLAMHTCVQIFLQLLASGICVVRMTNQCLTFFNVIAVFVWGILFCSPKSYWMLSANIGSVGKNC